MSTMVIRGQLTVDDMLRDDVLSEALEWREANPKGWAALVRWAAEDTLHGVRPSMSLYAELLRHPHFARELGLEPCDEEYTLRNALRAALARLLVREHGFDFRLSSSRYDREAA